jgi:hypothetical protein
MDYYKPFQNLSYMYSIANNAIYLRSSLNVFLPHKETLTSQDAAEMELKYFLKFTSISDVTNSEDYLYCHDSLIKIPMKFAVKYDPKALDSVKNSIQKNIEADLINKGISFYSVTTTVHKRDGSVGGQVSNTISQQGEVVIL